MKNIFSIILLCVIFSNLDAQKLEFVHSRQILLNGEKLSREQVIEHLKNNPEIQDEYRLGKSLRTVGDVTFFGGIGCFILRIMQMQNETVENANINNLEQDKGVKVLPVVGTLLLVATIPLKVAGKSKIRNSIKEYNKTQQTGFNEVKPNYDLSLVSNRNGLGLQVTF